MSHRHHHYTAKMYECAERDVAYLREIVEKHHELPVIVTKNLAIIAHNLENIMSHIAKIMNVEAAASVAKDVQITTLTAQVADLQTKTVLDADDTAALAAMAAANKLDATTGDPLPVTPPTA